MRWVGRLFDERDTLARLMLLNLSGIGYLVLRPVGEPAPTGPQWALALTGFTTILLLYRLPFVNALWQTALLGVAIAILDDPLINQVGASWSLLELTMRTRRLALVWVAAGAHAAVFLAGETDGWPASIAASVFSAVTVIGLPVLLGVVVRNSRELARQAERRGEEDRRRREYEDQAARAAERAAIARELHDVVAHHVASMVLRVGVARHVLDVADPRVTEVFDDVHGTGTVALADLRRLVELLRDPAGVRPDAAATAAVEPGTLPEALRAAVDEARRTGLEVTAAVDPAVGGLDAVRGLAVLRLTQEALTNVAKHAGPSAHARLTVTVTGGDVRIEVADDGDSGGVPAVDRPAGGGHGLTGMRERVEVFGGWLEAGRSGAGWRVTAVLPDAGEAA
ncbi:sensor histidine kinase [Spirilliplanes yamanashiensis]|uniref:sensor histidine kinase n=1 Tax=Spirilliplanes yamanashiensis TaxID=42233 RepID=UPI00194E9677|nr:histidine kinase [Spirilliplanes yamanashiensis]MDP9817715.1 signal transduction histidine kinase [Spirilliplanes yamanashiensis]